MANPYLSESIVTPYLIRALSLFAVLTLAACAAPTPPLPEVMPGYEAVQDEEFLIQAVPTEYLQGTTPRAEVDYSGKDAPGTIVVDPHARRLYYVLENGRAMRYAIAVGRSGLGFRGAAVVGRKQKWPAWTPTANMIRTMPEMYGEFAGGLPGGLENPLGARALYLYRGGRDSYFRIHGTIDNRSIGKATSAGCIRLFNQDAIDLYERVNNGTRVRVRSAEESLEIEGPMMDDINGRAIPYDAELEAKIAEEKLAMEAKAAEEAAAAAEAEAKAKAEAEAEAAQQAAADAGTASQG